MKTTTLTNPSLFLTTVAFSQYIWVWNTWVKIVVFVLMENMITVKSEQVTYWRWSCSKSNKSTQWRQLRTRAPQRHPSSYHGKCILFPCCQSAPRCHPLDTIHEAPPASCWKQFYCFLMKLHTNSCLYAFSKESHQYKRSFSFPHYPKSKIP